MTHTEKRLAELRAKQSRYEAASVKASKEALYQQRLAASLEKRADAMQEEISKLSRGILRGKSIY